MTQGLINGWISLILAILFSVVGTTNMKLVFEGAGIRSMILLAISYFFAFIEMTFALKYIELSILYAVWSGIGTLLVSSVGMAFFNERVSLKKTVYLILIIIGVIGMHLGDYPSKL